jgi:UDP-2,4-diacetamido-2,4,6-trideoxy-beta-L-altropyranose hydrolase
MKVLILTEGGRKLGFGHVSRCLALYQAFEERDISPLFAVNGDDTVQEFLKGTKHCVFNWLLDENKLSDSARGSDIVIIDSYLADLALYRQVSRLLRTSVYIDDNRRLDYPAGIVVNGSIFAEEMPYPKRTDIKYLLGVQYMPQRKPFWDVPDIRIRDRISSLMITLGGDDSAKIMPLILRVFICQYPDITKKVVIGKGFHGINEVEELRDERTEMIYYPDAEKMKEVMLSSDIAISAGGQTLYELARIGVPSIAIATADNQLYNVQGWLRAEFIEYAGSWEDRGLKESLKDCFERLTDKETRMVRSLRGKHFIDGQGSRRIISTLLGRES